MAKILVAEDEESVRNLVTRALQLHDHEVKAVVDGSAALEALSRDRYDLLLTDIVMPIVDGIALALKASAEYPEGASGEDECIVELVVGVDGVPRKVRAVEGREPFVTAAVEAVRQYRF